MRVITTPSLLQVTVVAGPPVEVQVRVLDWSSKVRLVTMGEPAWVYKLKVKVKSNTTGMWVMCGELVAIPNLLSING